MYGIVVSIGQSNMRAFPGTFPANAPDPNIFQLSRGITVDQLSNPLPYAAGANNDVILANDPLQHFSVVGDSAGMAIEFAKLTRDTANNEQILIVACAEGGTALAPGAAEWTETGGGGIHFNDAVNRTNFALTNFPGSYIKAIIWHQGESDHGNPNYLTHLDNFINAFRAAIGAPTAPFIAGGLADDFINIASPPVTPGGGFIDGISRTIQDRHNFAWAASGAGLATIDNTHFDRDGIQTLAHRYACAYHLCRDHRP